jgi:hypothetical protein
VQVDGQGGDGKASHEGGTHERSCAVTEPA